LSVDALKTDTQISFQPLIHLSYNQFNNLYGSQIGMNGDGLNSDQVFDMREMRFIIPPAPHWDHDGEDGYIYSAQYDELLPYQAYNTTTYFNNDVPYSWAPE
jgi:hypothetical protein